MNPYMKGALGFIGAAGVIGTAYAIGKHVGRERTLHEIEIEERYLEDGQPVYVQTTPREENKNDKDNNEAIEVTEDAAVISSPQPIKQSAVERVRKMHGHGIKGIFGGTSVIKDLLKNPDGKKLVLTVEDGDIVARISQKEE